MNEQKVRKYPEIPTLVANIYVEILYIDIDMIYQLLLQDIMLIWKQNAKSGIGAFTRVINSLSCVQTELFSIK